MPVDIEKQLSRQKSKRYYWISLCAKCRPFTLTHSRRLMCTVWLPCR